MSGGGRGRGGGGTAVEKSLEIVIKQVLLEGSFERGGRSRVAQCLTQILSNRWARVRRRSFTKCFCVYTKVRRWSPKTFS